MLVNGGQTIKLFAHPTRLFTRPTWLTLLFAVSLKDGSGYKNYKKQTTTELLVLVHPYQCTRTRVVVVFNVFIVLYVFSAEFALLIIVLQR